MSNQHHSARTAGRRIFRWLGSAERPASAAAANGEPAPLLALEAWQRVRPSVEERPRHPDGVDAAGPSPGAVRPREVEQPMSRHTADERSER
jgi:hypothetical protein